jgi:cardiolipin synthase A/B
MRAGDARRAGRREAGLDLPARSPPAQVRRRRWIRWIVGLTLGVPLAVLLAQVGHRILDTLGTAPVRSVRPLGDSAAVPATHEPGFVQAMAALAETPMHPGHQIELLTDGAASLARFERDLRDARRSLLVQTYYCEPGQVTATVQAVLMAKAREGVRVLFLRDGFGCASLGGAYEDSLAAAGVEVATVRPLHWYSLHRAQHRSHVRSVIVDGRFGYTGGFGLADKWLPGDGGRPGWRETTVRFTGPAVEQLTGAFAIAWAEATGHLLVGDPPFSAGQAPPVEGAMGGLLYTTRRYGTPVPERYLALSLAGARRSVYLVNPYFIPNRELRQWLTEAVGRGVDVRVLTASRNTDVKLTRWASRTRYEELLEAGVRIYEYLPAMLHAKTMVVDGVFGSVGSLNLDNVSLRINDEAILLVQDSTLGAALEASFFEDLELSEEIVLERFRRRPVRDRLLESVARIVRDFL